MKTLIETILILIIICMLSIIIVYEVKAYDLLCMAERQIAEDTLLTASWHGDLLVDDPAYTIQYIGFTDGNGDDIGKLYLEDPMRFEGNAEESAKMFFEYVIKVQSNNRLLPELQHLPNE